MFESWGSGGLRLSCVDCLVDEEVSVVGFHYGVASEWVLSFFFFMVLFYFLTVLMQSRSPFSSLCVTTSMYGYIPVGAIGRLFLLLSTCFSHYN